MLGGGGVGVCSRATYIAVYGETSLNRVSDCRSLFPKTLLDFVFYITAAGVE